MSAKLPGRIAFILILVFCISFRLHTHAQQCIQFEGENSSPVAFAHVTIKDLQKNHQIQLITDDKGKVCHAVEPPFVVQLSHLGYLDYQDTIYQAQKETTIQIAESSFKLDDVVITAQHSAINTSEAVQNITVISNQQIKDKAAVNLYELLNNQLNIRLSTDNVLGSGIEMMGMGGDKVKIMIDGVPVIGRLGGNIDLSQINLSTIERVEIVEGPLSVNYGNDALAGTINLITKKTQKKKLELYSENYVESIGQYNFEGGIGFKKNENVIKTHFGRYFFDGYAGSASGREKQWDPKEQLFARVDWNRKLKKWKIGMSTDVYSEVITNRGAIDTIIEQTDSETRRIQVGNDDYYRTIRSSSALIYTRSFKEKYNLSGQLAYNYYQRRKNSYIKNLETLKEEKVPNASAHDTTGFQLLTGRGTLQASEWNNKLSWEVGYDLKQEYGNGPRIEGNLKTIGDYAGFSTVELKWIPELTLKGGVRITRNTEYDAPIIPSLDIKYTMGKRWQWRASYGKGFRAPNLKDLFYDFVDINHNIKGNTNLKAETSNSYSTSLSFKHAFSTSVLQSDVRFYYNHVSDLIGLALTNQEQGLYQNVNVNTHKTLGGQYNLKFRTKRWNIGGGVGYLGTYNIEFEENKDLDEFFYSPEIQATLSHNLKKPDVRIAFFYKYTGERSTYGLDGDDVIQFETEAYSMADLTLSKTFYKEHIYVAIGAKNLLDVENIASSGGGGTHSSSGATSIAWGRTYFVRIKLSL